MHAIKPLRAILNKLKEDSNLFAKYIYQLGPFFIFFEALERMLSRSHFKG